MPYRIDIARACTTTTDTLIELGALDFEQRGDDFRAAAPESGNVIGGHASRADDSDLQCHDDSLLLPPRP